MRDQIKALLFLSQILAAGSLVFNAHPAFASISLTKSKQSEFIHLTDSSLTCYQSGPTGIVGRLTPNEISAAGARFTPVPTNYLTSAQADYAACVASAPPSKALARCAGRMKILQHRTAMVVECNNLNENRFPAHEAPQARARPSVTGTAVTLDGQASTPEGGVVSYEWSLGGTLLATGRIARVTLPPGAYLVTLKVTDSSGAIGYDLTKVEVTSDQGKRPPIARVVNSLENSRVSFDGSQSGDPDGSVVRYEWREGNTLLSEKQADSVTLPAGEHALTLTVIDDQGLTDTVLFSVTVPPPAH